MSKPKKISFSDLIDKCQKDSSCNDWAEIGNISVNLGKIIKEKNAIDITDYRIVVEGAYIIHSIKRHGPKSKDRNPIDFPDFYCLPEILKNPDIVKSGEKKEQEKHTRLVFEKTIGQTYFCIEEIRTGSNKGGRICFISLRKRIIKQKPS